MNYLLRNKSRSDTTHTKNVASYFISQSINLNSDPGLYLTGVPRTHSYPIYENKHFSGDMYAVVDAFGVTTHKPGIFVYIFFLSLLFMFCQSSASTQHTLQCVRRWPKFSLFNIHTHRVFRLLFNKINVFHVPLVSYRWQAIALDCKVICCLPIITIQYIP